jgi:hypothetical protein
MRVSGEKQVCGTGQVLGLNAEVVNGRVDAGGERKALGVQCDEVVDSYLRSQTGKSRVSNRRPAPITPHSGPGHQQITPTKAASTSQISWTEIQHRTMPSLYFIFYAQARFALAALPSSTAQAFVPDDAPQPSQLDLLAPWRPHPDPLSRDQCHPAPCPCPCPCPSARRPASHVLPPAGPLLPLPPLLPLLRHHRRLLLPLRPSCAPPAGPPGPS